ncbi:MAG: hypothetical protein AB7L76_19790 [Burkholderiaceae bacterium]
MLKLIVAAAAALFTLNAYAADPSCSVRAAEKKLAGAAKNSFMKKCQNDSKASCETAATDKKLHGAARNSFVKKCVNDAVGKAG